MTLGLSRVLPIAGRSAKRIRDTLRRALGALREEWLTDQLRYDAVRAGDTAKGMELAAYEKRNRDRDQRTNILSPRHVVTDKGPEIMRASELNAL